MLAVYDCRINSVKQGDCEVLFIVDQTGLLGFLNISDELIIY